MRPGSGGAASPPCPLDEWRGGHCAGSLGASSSCGIGCCGTLSLATPPLYVSLCKIGGGGLCLPRPAAYPIASKENKTDALGLHPSRFSFSKPEVRLGVHSIRIPSPLPNPVVLVQPVYRGVLGKLPAMHLHADSHSSSVLITSSGRPSLIYPPHLPPPVLITPGPASSPTLILLLPKGI